MGAIYTKRSQNTRRNKGTLRKTKFGKYLFKLWEDLKRCIIWRFIIGIWRQLIFSLQKTVLLCWAIWMYQKLPKRVCFTLRREHHTMPVQRFGVTNLMIINLISGLLVVCCMSLWLLSHLLELKTWMDCIKRFLKVSIRRSQVFFLVN